MVVPSCWSRYEFARCGVSKDDAKDLWKKVRPILRKLAKSDESLELQPAFPSMEVLFHQIDRRRLQDETTLSLLWFSDSGNRLDRFKDLIVPNLETSRSFFIVLEWQGALSEVSFELDIAKNKLKFSIDQKGDLTKTPDGYPNWSKLVKLLRIESEVVGTERGEDWIPMPTSDKVVTDTYNNRSNYRVSLEDQQELLINHHLKKPGIYLSYSMPLPSIAEALSLCQKVTDGMATSEFPVQAYYSTMIFGEDVDAFIEKTKSEARMWTSVQYENEDDDDDEDNPNPKPNPFKADLTGDGSLSVYPVVALQSISEYPEKDSELSFQMNMVYSSQGTYLEFVSSQGEKWFDWIEKEFELELERWDGPAKGRWGWYA